VTECGYDLHAGFWNELQRIQSSGAWKPLQTHLSSECPGGVFATGHSLGGALATIFAACTNSDPSIPFKVQGVYTIGAPAVAKTQVWGGRCGMACYFKLARHCTLCLVGDGCANHRRLLCRGTPFQRG